MGTTTSITRHQYRVFGRENLGTVSRPEPGREHTVTVWANDPDDAYSEAEERLGFRLCIVRVEQIHRDHIAGLMQRATRILAEADLPGRGYDERAVQVLIPALAVPYGTAWAIVERFAEQPPKPTWDLSGYRSAAGAAKALHKAIVDYLEADRIWEERQGLTYRGPRPEQVHLRGPRDADEAWAADGWHVVWEEGPYDWASNLLGGDGLYGGEGARGLGPSYVPTDDAHIETTVGWTFSVLFRDVR